MSERVAEKCDFCCGRMHPEQDVFTYTTPATGTLEEARRGEAYWCEDPYWAACLECHQIIEAHANGEAMIEQAMVGLVRRSLSNQQIAVISPDSEELTRKIQEDQMQFIVNVIRLFFENREPGFKVGAPDV
jgi:hypothetical protein